MKIKTIVSTVMALSLLSGGFAFADDQDHGPDCGHGNPHDSNSHDKRGDVRHDDRRAGPNHAWYRGGLLPPEYRGRQYVVDDWRGHQLIASTRLSVSA